jgi:hypothetical protein
MRAKIAVWPNKNNGRDDSEKGGNSPLIGKEFRFLGAIA